MTLQQLEDVRELLQSRGQRASFEDLRTYLRLVRCIRSVSWLSARMAWTWATDQADAVRLHRFEN